MNDYKVEIYVGSQKDAALIIKILELFFQFFSDSYSFKAIPELGKTRVVHLHYRLSRRLTQ